MQIILILLLAIVWALQTVHRLAILQQKDYLIQRILVDDSSRKISVIDVLLLFFLILEIASNSLLVVLIGILLCLIMIALEGVSLLRHRFRRPHFTGRVIFIGGIVFLLGMILAVLITLLFQLSLSFTLVLLSLFSFWLTILANQISKFFVNQAHRREMRKASKQLAALTNAKVIGITGSYGKSSIKSFLYSILKQSHVVISTPESINTDIGIARFLNQEFAKRTTVEKQKIEFVILEMDALIPGTLARLVKYYPLDLALISAINEQHLDTFGGDIKNTIKGNAEILTGFKPGAKKIAVFNNDNTYSKQIATEFKNLVPDSQQYFYSFSKQANSDSYISNLKQEYLPGSSSLIFDLNFDKETAEKIENVQLPVLATFSAGNFAAAALIAKLCGATDQAIRQGALQAKLKEHTLEMKLTESNIEIIDDTFNGNPDGIRSFLQILKERKLHLPCPTIIVFAGLWDIGENSERIQAELGQEMLEVADYLMISHPTWGKYTLSKIPSEEREKRTLISNDPQDLAKLISKIQPNLTSNPRYRICLLNKLPSALIKYVAQL